jgi:hypothetical protein
LRTVNCNCPDGLRSLCIGTVAQHDPNAGSSCAGRLEAYGACPVAPLPPLATGRTACGRTATALLCADVDSSDEGVLPYRCASQSARQTHRSAPAEEPPANTYPSTSPAAADPEVYSWSVHYPCANNGRYGCAIPSRCPLSSIRPCLLCTCPGSTTHGLPLP